MLIRVERQVMREVNGNWMQVFEVTDIETAEEFDVKEARDIINGEKLGKNGKPMVGLTIGDKEYFRCLEIVNIKVV